MAKVIIAADACKGCGLCVRACPKNILAFKEGTINLQGVSPVYCIDMEACIGCANCARMCPHVCIEVER